MTLILHPAHPAAVDGRSIFAKTIADPEDAARLLKRCDNRKKIGATIQKGRYRDYAVYSLTLEERASCPRDCPMWLSCYGNGVFQQRVQRFRHGPELIRCLDAEIEWLCAKHPNGVAVRLHLLGDFWSVGYVRAWLRWIRRHPNLFVFGYTARRPGTAIGDVLADARRRLWSRFAVRLSHGRGAKTTRILDAVPSAPRINTALVCPEQMGRVSNCASCGLCWNSTRQIAFVDHAVLNAASAP